MTMLAWVYNISALSSPQKSDFHTTQTRKGAIVYRLWSGVVLILLSFIFSSIQNSCGPVPSATWAIVPPWQWRCSTFPVTCIYYESMQILSVMCSLSALSLFWQHYFFPFSFTQCLTLPFFLSHLALRCGSQGCFHLPCSESVKQAWDCRASPGVSFTIWHSSLRHAGLNCADPPIHGFLSINTEGPSYPWVLYPQIQAVGIGKQYFCIPNCRFPTLDWKHCFDPQLWRANCS